MVVNVLINMVDPNIQTFCLFLSFQFKLSDLGFDHHAKDKFLRLVGTRYDKATDIVTIITDRLVSL